MEFVSALAYFNRQSNNFFYRLISGLSKEKHFITGHVRNKGEKYTRIAGYSAKSVHRSL